MPTPYRGEWLALEVTDALTDERSLQLAVQATDHNLERPYEDNRVVLYIICTADRKKVVVWWHKFLYAGFGASGFDNGMRWDGKAAVKGRWTENADNTATIYHPADGFIRQAEQADTLFIRIWDFEEKAHDATFDLRGLTTYLDEYSEYCR